MEIIAMGINPNSKKKILISLFSFFITTMMVLVSLSIVLLPFSNMNYYPIILRSTVTLILIPLIWLFAIYMGDVKDTKTKLILFLNTMIAIIFAILIISVVGVLGMALSAHGSDYLPAITLLYVFLSVFLMWFLFFDLISKHKKYITLSLAKIGILLILGGVTVIFLITISYFFVL